MPYTSESTAKAFEIVSGDHMITASELLKKLNDMGYKINRAQAASRLLFVRMKLDLIHTPTRGGCGRSPYLNAALEVIKADPQTTTPELARKLAAQGINPGKLVIKRLFSSARRKLKLIGKPTRGCEGSTLESGALIAGGAAPISAVRGRTATRPAKPPFIQEVSVKAEDAFDAVKRAFELASLVPELQSRVRKLTAELESYHTATQKKKNETYSYLLARQQGKIGEPLINGKT